MSNLGGEGLLPALESLPARPCLREFFEEACLAVWDLGPVDFWALALLASNFETLVFIAFFHLELELLDLESQLLMQLRHKLGRVMRLHKQADVLELPIDQSV